MSQTRVMILTHIITHLGSSRQKRQPASRRRARRQRWQVGWRSLSFACRSFRISVADLNWLKPRCLRGAFGGDLGCVSPRMRREQCVVRRVYCRGTASSRQRKSSRGCAALTVQNWQTKAKEEQTKAKEDTKEKEEQLAEALLLMRDLQERNQELMGELQQHVAEEHANTKRLVSELEAANERSRECEGESYALTIQVETLSNHLKAESQHVAETQKEREEVVLQLQQAQRERDEVVFQLQMFRETEAQMQRSLTDRIPACMPRAASMSRAASVPPACARLPLLTMRA